MLRDVGHTSRGLQYIGSQRQGTGMCTRPTHHRVQRHGWQTWCSGTAQ